MDTYKTETVTFSLRDENIELKKRLHANEDAAKRLATKVQRLSEELSHKRVTGFHQTLGRGEVTQNRKEERESKSLIVELRSQVEELAKSNSTLKSKLGFFKTLHESDRRKRTPYDHIPPRIITSNRNINIPRPRPIHCTYSPQKYAELEEDLKLQQQLVGALREKLSESEKETKLAKDSLKKISDEFERKQQQNDIDRMALQLETNEKRKRNEEIIEKYESLDTAHRILTASHNELVAVAECLSKDVQIARQKSDQLEHSMKNNTIQHQSEAELLTMIEDIRMEKRMAEQELQTVLNTQFSKNCGEEYHQEVNQLRKQISEHGVHMKAEIEEKIILNKTIVELRARLEELTVSKTELEAALYNAKHCAESLKDELNLFSHNGKLTIAEIEEALTIAHLKREHDATIGMSPPLNSVIESAQTLQLLRVQFSECVQELEKSTKLLNIQESITRDLKTELKQSQLKLESKKNEYELRLGEDSKLLEFRKQRIALLESQVKDIIYGISKLPTETTCLDREAKLNYPSQLPDKGQTAIEIKIDSAVFSQEGRRHLIQAMPILKNTKDNVIMFVAVEFFEFETEFSGLGTSWSPQFDHTIRYNINADDYLLTYLQTRRMSLRIYYTNTIDYVLLSCCHVSLGDFLSNDNVTKKRFVVDMLSEDRLTVVGKLDFTAHIRVPITLAVPVFKEQTTALNVSRLNISQEKWEIFKPRGKINELHFLFKSGEFKNCSSTSTPKKIYGTCLFGFGTAAFVTPTVCDTHIPVFNFEHTLPFVMSAALNNHLVSEKCEIVFCDEVSDVFYGRAVIPLIPLSLGDAIDGRFELLNEKGEPCGEVNVLIKWGSVYTMDITPVVLAHESNMIKESPPKIASAVVQSTLPKHLVQPLERYKKVLSNDERTKKVEFDATRNLLDSINTSAIHPDCNDTMPTRSNQIPSELQYCDRIHIQIDRLEIDYHNNLVLQYFSKTSQVFVRFDLLGYPLEELETESVSLKDSQVLQFKFSKEFPLDRADHAEHRASLIEMLIAGTLHDTLSRTQASRPQQPTNPDEELSGIVFTIVHEPSEEKNGDEYQECVDLGYCTFSLRQLLQIDPLPRKRFNTFSIPVIDASGTLQLGTLHLSVNISEDVLDEARRKE
ncbi:hypothetical protein BASA50_004440 [Batrachochytrium salamandrivorans]|uniref:RPGR-interacting protein 1 first C2 domain-containing protein n=1 Tax=Batrachochytrium salamandrivorans TaxID=1357716 RepID=A0ABQ8FFT6_9FUNG|nr:hypothetical protein BASA50_004440 [Batrachochytrium salamandrivorans]